MSSNSRNATLNELKPPFAGLTGLFIFLWIVFGLFHGLDDDRYYFAISMCLSGILTAYQLRSLRMNSTPMQGGTIVFFVLIWLATFIFTNEDSLIRYMDYSISIKDLEFIAFIPLAFIWFLPFNQEKFFGVQDLEPKDKFHAVWRSSVLLLIVVNLIHFPDKWYWNSVEFIILIPMVYETIKLQNYKKEQLPVLTLFIQTEISTKFEVPFSILKSVFLIMTAFLFEILSSRLWLLIILLYFGIASIWFFASLIPEDMKTETGEKELEETIMKVFGETKGSRRRERRRGSKKDKIKPTSPIKDESISNSLVVQPKKETNISMTQGGNIQEKAHAFGQKVRTGIEKPYYTLNHILSTLKEEDLSHAWRVEADGLNFPSTRGNWSPPKDLILFPIELSRYDYRRADEILLLGFNRPIDKKDGSLKFEFGDDKKSKAKIGPNLIRFEDVEFNTRSLIVTIEQWEEIKKSLKIVTQDEDISHTGFSNLIEMQKTLVSMSDKWMEVRMTAQEAAVNFLAGLLGSSEPIFISNDDLKSRGGKQIEGETYEVEDES